VSEGMEKLFWSRKKTNYSWIGIKIDEMAKQLSE
jgi:hypothetical protein